MAPFSGIPVPVQQAVHPQRGAAAGTAPGGRLLRPFRQHLLRTLRHVSLPATWADPRRRLSCLDYLSLRCFGLLAPLPRSARGLGEASRLERFRAGVCAHPVSLGSCSEAQHQLPPDLLPRRFADLSRQVRHRHPGHDPAHRRWWAHDGSLLAALPRMYWAFWRRRYGPESQVRLHLSLDLLTQAPARAQITPGRDCERALWRRQWEPGQAYVGDSYYGEHYAAFAELDQQGVAFVIRVRDQSVVPVEEELACSAADRRAGVVRGAWVRLGRRLPVRSIRLRMVWIDTPKGTLRGVTNLGPEELEAGEVALLYRQRWQVERFFRWIKCTLRCQHWQAESPEGVRAQVYLALIVALRQLLRDRDRPTQRVWEPRQWQLLGWASEAEVEAVIQREAARSARRQRS